VSQIILNKGAVPAPPGTNKVALIVDQADGKLKALDWNGVLGAVLLDGWRDKPVMYNGGFEFWQRQLAATATTYSSIGGRVYCADRWCVSNENASVTAARVDTETSKEAGLGTRYYGQFAKTANAGKLMVAQVLGASSIMTFRGGLARLQFLLKGSTAATLRVGLVQNAAAGTVDAVQNGAAAFVTAWGANSVDPTMGTNLPRLTPVAGSADGGTISGDGMSCSITTSWQRFSCCFNPPNDCHNLVVVIWSDSQFAVGQTFSMSEVGLYDGPEIRTNFVQYSSSLEILRCQKYYQKTFALSAAPAQNAGVIGALRTQVAIAGAVATSSAFRWQFGVPLRGTPITTTFYNPSAANAFMRNVPAATDATATAAANASEFGMDVNCTGLAAWTVGQELKVHCAVDAEL